MLVERRPKLSLPPPRHWATAQEPASTDGVAENSTAVTASVPNHGSPCYSSLETCTTVIFLKRHRRDQKSVVPGTMVYYVMVCPQIVLSKTTGDYRPMPTDLKVDRGE